MASEEEVVGGAPESRILELESMVADRDRVLEKVFADLDASEAAATSEVANLEAKLRDSEASRADLVRELEVRLGQSEHERDRALAALPPLAGELERQGARCQALELLAAQETALKEKWRANAQSETDTVAALRKEMAEVRRLLESTKETARRDALTVERAHASQLKQLKAAEVSSAFKSAARKALAAKTSEAALEAQIASIKEHFERREKDALGRQRAVLTALGDANANLMAAAAHRLQTAEAGSGEVSSALVPYESSLLEGSLLELAACKADLQKAQRALGASEEALAQAVTESAEKHSKAVAREQELEHEVSSLGRSLAIAKAQLEFARGSDAAALALQADLASAKHLRSHALETKEEVQASLASALKQLQASREAAKAQAERQRETEEGLKAAAFECAELVEQVENWREACEELKKKSTALAVGDLVPGSEVEAFKAELLAKEARARREELALKEAAHLEAKAELEGRLQGAVEQCAAEATAAAARVEAGAAEAAALRKRVLALEGALKSCEANLNVYRGESVLGRKLEVAAYGPPLRVESGGALLHLLQLEDDQAADQAAVAGMRVDAKLREVEQEASEAKRFFSTEKLRLERTVWAAQSELGRAVGALEIAKQAANEDMMQAEKRFHEQRRALESELELARAHARAAEAAMAEAEEERALEAALGEARQKEAGADGWGLGA